MPPRSGGKGENPKLTLQHSDEQTNSRSDDAHLTLGRPAGIPTVVQAHVLGILPCRQIDLVVAVELALLSIVLLDLRQRVVGFLDDP